MTSLLRGRYRVRFTTAAEDVARAQELRLRCFPGASGQGGDREIDPFDARCVHVLIEEIGTDDLVCCFRLMPLTAGAEIGQSYSAQFYELSALAGFQGRMVEMGRFCTEPARTDPDILRVAWGAMTDYVDREGVEMLFGCSSFLGTEPGQYLDAFAMLRERHIAPRRWLPRVKAPRVFRFGQILRARRADPKAAARMMPPLLRTYLMMGGWVSDHAVVDAELGTLHVFTGVEVGKVPAARARLLRALAGTGLSQINGRTAPG